MPTLQEELTGLIRVLKYYAFFRYAATADDIYVTYPYQVSRSQLDSILITAVKEGRILTEKVAETSYYTMPSHGISLHEVERKVETTKQKLDKVYPFLFFSKYSAPVCLIGLSGSLAMQNAGKNDDVDFFVISKPGHVWSARFMLLVIASALGLRRRRGEQSPSGKVCLNLFFDGSDLQVPEQKRNLYVAHEIVQMKPLYMKGDIYERFLNANEWVKEYLPNYDVARYTVSRLEAGSLPFRTLKSGTGLPTSLQTGILAPFISLVGFIFEPLFKQLQLFLIQKHLTNELVSNTQMWFYPDDFEEKLKKSKML